MMPIIKFSMHMRSTKLNFSATLLTFAGLDMENFKSFLGGGLRAQFLHSLKRQLIVALRLLFE